MMIGAWHMELGSPLVIASAVLLLASFFVTLRMIRRRGTSARRFWLVAALNTVAYGAILLLLLNPQSPIGASRTVTLITDTPAPSSNIEGPAYLMPGMAAGETPSDGTPLYALGQLPIKEPGLAELTIIGHGLDDDSWRMLPEGVRVTWQPPALNGLYDTRWPKRVMVGESWQITGAYKADESAKPDAIFTLELSDPAGNVVDSQRLKSGQRFNLAAHTKASGPLVYSLTVTDRKDTIIGSEGVPVSAERPTPVKVMLVQSAPSFEARHMLEWAARFGADLTVQTQISKDRYLTQSSLPDAPQQIAPFAPDTLAAQDMLVIDGRSLTGLNGTRLAALEEAVRAGLGLMIVADSDLIGKFSEVETTLLESFTLRETGARDHTASPRWPSYSTEMPLPVLPYRLDPTSGTPLVISSTGNVLNLMQEKGMGRVSLSLLRQRHAWATSGDTALYAAYWSYMMGQLSRPATAPRLLPMASDRLVRTADKTTLCALTTETELSVEITRDGATTGKVALVSEKAGSPRHCAAFFPQMSGWYGLKLLKPDAENKPLDSTSLYVHGQTAWPAVDAYKRQTATRLHTALADNQPHVGESNKLEKAIPPFWLWLALVITATLLWVERKLD